jgi:formylmethanofuran dehydrogenase subunit E
MSLVKSFHYHVSPGVLIGGFMIELAYRNLPPETIFDVICETSKCLPDAVQLLTPCTIGNRWLKIIDVGRYALAFYDKYSGEGVRVHLVHDKIEAWPEIKTWFLKLKPKQLQDSQRLFSQIKEADTGIYQVEKIRVARDFLKKEPDEPVSFCPLCHEVFLSSNGAVCPACSGKYLPYRSGSNSALLYYEPVSPANGPSQESRHG